MGRARVGGREKSNFFVAVDEGGKREEKGRGKKKKEKKKEEGEGRIMRPNAIFSPSNFTFYIILFLPHRSGHQFVAQNVLKVDPERLAAHRHHVQRRRAPTPTPHLLRAATLHDVLRYR